MNANPTPDMPALREALEPFAKAADIRLCGGDHWTDDKSIQGTDVAFHIKFGDLRRARETLSSSLAPRSGSVGEDLEWAARKAENMGRCANGSGGADCCERLGEDIAEDIREYATSQPPAAPETSEGATSAEGATVIRREWTIPRLVDECYAQDRANLDPDYCDFIRACGDALASLPAVDAGRREAAEIAEAVERQQDNDHGAANTGGAAAAAEAIRARIGKTLAGEA